MTNSIINRRSFLVFSAAAATFIFGRKLFSKPNFQPAKNAKLAIPPLMEGTLKDGVYHYDLTIQKAKHMFFEGALTNTYAMNATYLAPTLHLKNGTKVSINYTNKLDEVTTMHGHGMHLPASMDGSPWQPIAPNDTWSAQYTVKQRACTNWYHPHAEGKTAEHVYMGLAGFLIIDDEESKKISLPKEYGVDDLPIVLQDRFFDYNAQLYYNPNMQQIMKGYKSELLITNGVINPYADVKAKNIRLRLLNGSNSTVYRLAFSDDRDFVQVATDNSFLEEPVEMDTLKLSPGERAEIIVDMSDDFGQKVALIETKLNRAFVTLNVNEKATTNEEVPDKLTTLDKYSLKNVTNKRKFVLTGGMGRVYINDVRMDMAVINEVVPINKVELWEIHNKQSMMGMEHNFHIHGTHFMVVERNGRASNVHDNEKGYKDTVYLNSGEQVKVLVKMTDYTDDVVPYMYHCHFLEHEDRGMMGQFTVV